MSSNKCNTIERPTPGYLNTEIAHLKEYIWEMEDNHRLALGEWTRKCGQLGNQIGRLRRQINDKENEYRAELDRMNNDHRAALNTWIKKCDQLGNEMGSLRKFVNKEVGQQAELDQMTLEIDRLRQRLLDKEIECDLQLKKSSAKESEMNNELKALRSKLAEVSMENGKLLDRSNVHPIKNEKVDLNATINTCDNSECERAGQKSLNNSVETTDQIGGSQQDLAARIAEQVLEDDDEELKRKSKSSLWNTLKRHISTNKGKREKYNLSPSFTLTREISEIEEK